MAEIITTKRRSYLDIFQFNRVCTERGLPFGYQRAEAIGVSPAAMSRALHGGSLSAQFVIGCMRAFGAEAHSLFRTGVVA